MAYGHRWKDAADEAKHHKQTMEEDESDEDYDWGFYPGTLEWYPNLCFGGLTPHLSSF